MRAHQSDVTVVPCIIIHECGPVGHPCYLVAIVPPRHDTRMLVCILPQPVVRLPEVVKDVARPNRRMRLTGNSFDRHIVMEDKY